MEELCDYTNLQKVLYKDNLQQCKQSKTGSQKVSILRLNEQRQK